MLNTMLNIMNFDGIIKTVEGATKSNKINVYHIWDGWVSRGVLHIVSRSGSATRAIWHFNVDENEGGRLMFKNTAGKAYVYARPGARNKLEEKVLKKMNQYCRFEQQPTIDVEMQTRGTSCGHVHVTDDYPFWYVILTDGKIEMVRKALEVTRHPNEYHIGCPTGADIVRVTGGTYVIQIDVAPYRDTVKPITVVTTPQADLVHIAKVLYAEEVVRAHDTWLGNCGDGSGRSKDAQKAIILLATEVAEGYPYADHIRERVWRLCGECTPAIFLPKGLRERVAYMQSASVAHRALVEKVIEQIKCDFKLYRAEECGSFVVFLPKSEIPDWETLFGYNGKLSSCQFEKERVFYGDMSRLMHSQVDWPSWVEKGIREACGKYQRYFPQVPENLRLARGPVIGVVCEDYLGSSREVQVMILSDLHPDVDFRRMRYNRFWEIWVSNS